MKAIVFTENDLHNAKISAQILSDDGCVVGVEVPRVIINRLVASHTMIHTGFDQDKWAASASIKKEMLAIARLFHKLGYKVLDANLDDYPGL